MPRDGRKRTTTMQKAHVRLADMFRARDTQGRPEGRLLREAPVLLRGLVQPGRPVLQREPPEVLQEPLLRVRPRLRRAAPGHVGRLRQAHLRADRVQQQEVRHGRVSVLQRRRPRVQGQRVYQGVVHAVQVLVLHLPHLPRVPTAGELLRPGRATKGRLL